MLQLYNKLFPSCKGWVQLPGGSMLIEAVQALPQKSLIASIQLPGAEKLWQLPLPLALYLPRDCQLCLFFGNLYDPGGHKASQHLILGAAS